MKTIAIIGTGISGLGCAHFLHRDFDITLFEQNRHVGGHAHTVTVRETETDREVPIDTGFMVYNRVTYPLLTRLFDHLDVPVMPTDMSFGIRDHATGIEWCGSSLNHLFAQRKNLFNRRFLKMLRQVDRFNREAVPALDDSSTALITLEDYVSLRGYGRDFLELYLLPMSSAVWSTDPELMLRFPAATLLRFFHNHGFLGLNTQHPWLTVRGGAREYVTRLTALWRHRIRRTDGVARIERASDGPVWVTTSAGEESAFDHVIIATHADQALGLLAEPTNEERHLLGSFGYQKNLVTLHTDPEVMPKTKRAWASWNFELARTGDGSFSSATHYWMNRLQNVSENESFFVSINRPAAIASEHVLRQINYQHPRFDLPAIAAQAGLPALNERAQGATETYFAGSYFGYGFHEDGLRSAAQLSQLLLGRDPWMNPPARVEPSLVATT